MRLEITHHFALHCKKKEALKLLSIKVQPTCILKTYVFFRIYLFMLKHTKEYVDHKVAFCGRIFLFLKLKQFRKKHRKLNYVHNNNKYM